MIRRPSPPLWMARSTETIVQQPYEFGYQAIKLMNSILAGDKSGIPENKQRIIPTLAVTKAYVNDYSDRINKLKGGS